jgi:hypothetical protein
MTTRVEKGQQPGQAGKIAQAGLTRDRAAAR